MPRRDRHRLRRPHRLGVRRALRRGRLRRDRDRERHARALLRPGGVDRAADAQRCSSALRHVPLRSTSTSATPTASTRVFAEHAQRDRARRPHRGAALARLGGVAIRRPTSRSTPTARSTCSRRRARHTPGRDLHLHARRTRSTATARTACRWSSSRRGSSCRRTTATSAASTRRCRSTRRLHSLFGVSKAAADLLVQEYGRYFDMPTVCFRGGCLTGPNHAGAQLHGFLAYLMRCTVTGEPYTVFGYGGKQVRDNLHSADLVARVRGLPRAARAPAAVYNIGGGPREQLLDARGDRALRADRRPRRSTGRSSDEAADRRPPLVDQRPRRRSGATTRAGGSSTTSRRSCARSTSRTSSAGARAVVKLSVVIPAHNEAGSIAATARARSPRRSSASEIDYEVLVVDDASTRRHRGGRRGARRERPARPLHRARTTRAASASPCAPASSASRATRSRS